MIVAKAASTIYVVGSAGQGNAEAGRFAVWISHGSLAALAAAIVIAVPGLRAGRGKLLEVGAVVTFIGFVVVAFLAMIPSHVVAGALDARLGTSSSTRRSRSGWWFGGMEQSSAAGEPDTATLQKWRREQRGGPIEDVSDERQCTPEL
jgi:hypothetical protein